jgi:hypothetical protein
MISISSGLSLSIKNVTSETHKVIIEQNLAQANIDTSNFSPDANHDIDSKVNVTKLYSDFDANNLDEVVNYLYTGDELTIPNNQGVNLTPLEITTLVSKDFLVPYYSYGNADATNENYLQLFYVLKKLAINDISTGEAGVINYDGPKDFSFKFSPYIDTKMLEFASISGGGIINPSSIRMIREEKDIKLNNEIITMYKNNNYEINIPKYNGKKVEDEEIAVSTIFFNDGNYNINDELEFLVKGVPMSKKIVSKVDTPQNIVPPAMQDDLQFGKITHDMTTTSIVEKDNFYAMANIDGSINIKSSISIGFKNIQDSLNNKTDKFNNKEFKDKVESNVFELEKYLFNYFEHTVVSPLSNNRGTTYNTATSPLQLMRPYYDGQSLTNNGVLNALNQIQTIQQMSIILMTLFTFILIVILLIFIKKRIEDNQKTNMALKSLGYGSRQIAISYLIYPIIIILLG